MSIIQSIRDKGAAIVIVVIALSLIGFLLMDARSGTGRLFGGNSRVIGSVNGKDIEMEEFNALVKISEGQYQNMGPREQIMQRVWDQMVGEKVIMEEINKLGLTYSPQEFSANILSENAPPALKQAFSDPETGQYDIEKARQWLREMKRNKNAEQREMINTQIIDPMRLNTLYTKYTSMIAGSIYIPAWMLAKENEESKSYATISYVAIPYSDISDSAIKVTDADIENYIEKNILKYKEEAGRMISYVSFSTTPNQKDSILAKSSLLALKNSFASDTNPKAFVSRNLSAINYADIYVPQAKLQSPAKDSIIALPDGGVYGPYIEGGNYVLAKKVSTKILPDSIKCRHILIGTADRQTGQPTLADSIAKQRIDSIENAIKGGANFDSLEAIYSTDEAAHKDKGVMTFDLESIQGENFAKEFADFLLNDNGETKKTVKTQFGWHYIEILEKKNPGPADKVAYMAKEIVASDETINSANIAATKFSGMARDEKAFDKYVKENGLNKISVPTTVRENDYQVGSLQDARDIVKWAFTAKEGEVSEPIGLKEQYVVAVVTDKIEKGLPDAKTARPMVESIIRNKKKAEQIVKKLGKPATLDAASAVFKKEVLTTGNDSTLTFNAFIINGVGSEPKVAGASFNKQYMQKVSPPIEGNTGVFVIKVNSINQRPADLPEIEAQKKSARINEMIQGGQGQMRPGSGALNGSFSSLKKMADIEDKRSKFF
jgi:peptidyl-prolyl cis-trans isomerase D